MRVVYTLWWYDDFSLQSKHLPSEVNFAIMLIKFQPSWFKVNGLVKFEGFFLNIYTNFTHNFRRFYLNKILIYKCVTFFGWISTLIYIYTAVLDSD